MTIQEIKEKLGILMNHPRISNLTYNSELIEEDREESLWYGGSLIQYRVDDRYNVSISALGDNIGCIFLRNGDVKPYKDKTNYGYLSYLLRQLGITKDSDFIVKNEFFDYSDTPDMTPFEENKELMAVIYVDYGNWFEISVDDGVTGDCTNAVIDSFESIFEPDFEWLEECFNKTL